MLSMTMSKADEIQTALERIGPMTRDIGGDALVVVEFPEDVRCAASQLTCRGSYELIGIGNGDDVLTYRDTRGRRGSVVVCPAFRLPEFVGSGESKRTFDLVIILECPCIRQNELIALFGMCNEQKCMIYAAATNRVGWTTLTSRYDKEETDE